jgi:hypothetical protein
VSPLVVGDQVSTGSPAACAEVPATSIPIAAAATNILTHSLKALNGFILPPLTDAESPAVAGALLILDAVPVTFLGPTSRQTVTNRTSLDYAEALGAVGK